jgi:hypothetical protein
MSAAPEALAAFDAVCAAVGEVWAGALLRPSAGVEADARAMSDDGLVRVTDRLGVLARVVESLQARCAAELASRCTGEDGADLARALGFNTPERLIAQSTGGRYSDAVKLVAVGRATASRASFTGGVLPARHPHLAAALEGGAVGVDAAEVIRRFLDGVEAPVDRGLLDEAEAFLVERAPAVGIDGLTRLIKHLEAHLDPDGVKPREDELRARRELRVWQDAAGMVNVRGALDPVNGAVVKAAIDGLVGAELRRARDARPGFGAARDGADREGRVTEPGTHGAGAGADADADADADAGAGAGAGAADPVFAEQRTIAQMNADALADLARHALGCAAVPTLRQVTVVARVDADALASGVGHATLDGIAQPVSIHTVRELVTSAGIAPLYIGTGCEKLELGRSVRLFTPAQKIALAERDGGCAWPGCGRPPAHTEAHHVAWWTRDDGTTDLDNGILLCSHHHHRIHNDGWRVFIRDGRSWFVPPAHLDPDQRPRPGTLAAERDIGRYLAQGRGADAAVRATRATRAA